MAPSYDDSVAQGSCTGEKIYAKIMVSAFANFEVGRLIKKKKKKIEKSVV